MEEIIQILVRRDGISREDAILQIRDCQGQLEYAIEDGDYELAVDTVANCLGLEPDFIPMLII